jgi:hypothetical protein
MTNAMATQEEEIFEEEDNDGAMNDQVNETEGVDNIKELQKQLIDQEVDVTTQPAIVTWNRNMIIDGDMNAQANSNGGIRIHRRVTRIIIE